MPYTKPKKKTASAEHASGVVETDEANVSEVEATAETEETGSDVDPSILSALSKITNNITKSLDAKVDTVLAAIREQTSQMQALATRPQPQPRPQQPGYPSKPQPQPQPRPQQPGYPSKPQPQPRPQQPGYPSKPQPHHQPQSGYLSQLLGNGPKNQVNSFQPRSGSKPGQQPRYASKSQQPGYPSQQPGYPSQQPGYPSQQPGYPSQPQPQQPGYPSSGNFGWRLPEAAPSTGGSTGMTGAHQNYGSKRFGYN
ncbi:calcium-binding protein P-like [Epinephelus moara]|uniref:calcium-binding protein P-like n=1 Tax=Epinephelus moara TaxID=300413 RepID=UPI00214F2BDD|nr:calcium-binding protein P-like [Epinephelus moara]